MKKVVNSLTEEALEADARRWLNIIRYHESGTIIQLQNDAVYRVNQLINDKKLLKKILGKYYRKYLLGYISLSENNLLKVIEEKVNKWGHGINLEESLKKIEDKGLDIGLFVDYSTNIILKQQEHKQFFELETILRKYKNLSVIIFSEIDITNPEFTNLVNQCSSIFTHIIKYPLYSEKDSLQFIAYNENLWKVKFPEKIKKEIVKNCGGYLWLIRQALRLLRDEKDLSLEQIFTHELMLKKLEVIWKKLTEPEREILRKIYNKNVDEESKNSHQYSYLKIVRIIVNESFGIPLLRLVINKEKKTNQLIVKDGEVYFNKENVSFQLTKSELRIIRFLIDNKNKLVSRNDIAQKIWGVNWEEHYSDWAIDRLIYRLRKKLKKIGYDENLIKTYKSRGIRFG